MGSSQAEAVPTAVATAQSAPAVNLPQAEESNQTGPPKAAMATGQTVRDQVKRHGGSSERGIPAHGASARDKSQDSRVGADTAAKAANASQPAAAHAEPEPAAVAYADKSSAAVAVDTHRVRTSGARLAGSNGSPTAAAGASQTPTGSIMPSALEATAAAPDDDDELDSTGSDSAAAPLNELKRMSSSQQSAAAAKAFGLADMTQPDLTPVMPARSQPKSALAETAGDPSSSPSPHSQLTAQAGAMLQPHGVPGRHTPPAGGLPLAVAASALHKVEVSHALVLLDAVPSPRRASAAAVLATPSSAKPGTPQPYTAEPVFFPEGHGMPSVYPRAYPRRAINHDSRHGRNASRHG